MIPFIDLLMCTIAFLLITAVWVTNSRIAADTQLPGQRSDDVDPVPVERVLHVNVAENEFGLVWRRAGTVVSEVHVPRSAIEVGGSEKIARYPELAKAIERDWKQFREHSDPSDKKRDTVVLHSDDRTPFKDLVAVLDAINGTRRDIRMPDGSVAQVAAFNPTFAVR